jgi:glycosyltransferase involved in cell wall biosynthesis/predicted metal-dependent phosphoesterase TrpH
MIPGPARSVRADLHCHSTASEQAKLGVQRALGLPECATSPDEVYELAKRRGMDFVTITDHDTIDGCLEIAGRDDVFVSEELTAWFRGEEQEVHVLCYGITDADHDELQARAADVEECVAYLRERGIACALAHPFFAVAAPLLPRHRRRLAELFGTWEVRNGSRAPELNQPAAIYVETNGACGIGGSDDHAGVDVGRTWTETPAAPTPQELLDHLRAGRAEAGGAQGSAAKWAHAGIALAARVLATQGEDAPPAVDPRKILELATKVVSDGGERGGQIGTGVGPDDARALLAAWVEAVHLDPDAAADPMALVRAMQADDFSHSELYRRARGAHALRLSAAIQAGAAALTRGEGYGEAGAALLAACVPAIPYAPATSFLAREKANLSPRDGDPPRVALVVDGAGSMHGVTHTVERIREHGVPGIEVEVVGTDSRVDRRLPAVVEAEVPFYPGLEVGVPTVPELVETLAEGRYELIHVTAPGPAGLGAALASRISGTPLVASHHTELGAYAALRAADPRLVMAMQLVLATLYRQATRVLSPSASADRSLEALGVGRERLDRWERGVDPRLFDPAKRDVDALPGELKVLYAGRLAREKGIELLADSFEAAHERDSRLHLVVAGGGPEEAWLRDRLGDSGTLLGWLGREELARAYASADLFLFCSRTDTYGQVITEAQASGLAVVAVAEGGPAELIRHRRTGWLCAPDRDEVASAVVQLAGSRFIRAQLGAGGREAVRARTWAASLEQLAGSYGRALEAAARNRAPAVSQQVA